MGTLKRIKQYIDYKGITNQKFEKEVGFSNGAFSSQLKKNKTIGVDKLENILTSYTEINPEWLLTGEGAMLKKNKESKEHIDHKKGVPYYDVDFTASFLEIENSHQSQPDSYISHPFFKDCEVVVRASGQSMAKVIKHGDAIGLIRVESWRDFIPMGEIYAIVTTNNFRMIKIITKGETKDSYSLISKPNDGKKAEFPPQQINKDKILSIFKVQASAHLF